MHSVCLFVLLILGIDVQPGQSIQQAVNSLDYATCSRNPPTVRIMPGDHEISSPIVIDRRIDVIANGAKITAVHDGDAIVFGTDLSEPYFATWTGGRITAKSATSKGRGFNFYRSNFVKLNHVCVDRFIVGYDCQGNDPVDIQFDDCYSNGCEIGYRLVGSNVTSIRGGKVVGDLTLHPTGVAFDVSRSNSVTIANVDCSFHAGGAIKATDCGSLTIQGIYTERIGPRSPLNSVAVVEINNCKQVEISGLLNGVGGPVGTNCDCETGLRITNCAGVSAKCWFLSCRKYEVIETRSTDCNYSGSTAELTWCPRYEPRIVRVDPKAVILQTSAPIVIGPATFDGETLTLLAHTQTALRLACPACLSGQRYRFSATVKLIEQGESLSGRSAVRMRVGRGSDSAIADFPLSIGVEVPVVCEWTAKASGESFAVDIGSRANANGQQNYANWKAAFTNMRLERLE